MEDCRSDLIEGLQQLQSAMDKHVAVVEVMLFPLLLNLSHSEFTELVESDNAESSSFKTMLSKADNDAKQAKRGLDGGSELSDQGTSSNKNTNKGKKGKGKSKTRRKSDH